MKYPTGKAFLATPSKRLAVIGLSGVGKTNMARRMPSSDWFIYSVDYRIWTHYLGDQLNDYLKALAMAQPILKELLKNDAITIEHRVQFDNLLATSAFMGMLGNPKLGGSTPTEFSVRMAKHAAAEIQAMLDIPIFTDRAEQLYSYSNVIIDAGGSACEVVDLDDHADPVLDVLAKNSTVVYIEATPDHKQYLLERAAISPKPIYYRPDFLKANIPKLLAKEHVRQVEELDPKVIGNYLYPLLLDHRATRYAAIADRIGYRVSMTDVLQAKSSQELLDLVADAIDTTKTAKI